MAAASTQWAPARGRTGTRQCSIEQFGKSESSLPDVRLHLMHPSPIGAGLGDRYRWDRTVQRLGWIARRHRNAPLVALTRAGWRLAGAQSGDYGYSIVRIRRGLATVS